jgi:lipid A disaccharide synthetase
LLSSVVYYFFALGVKNITKIKLKKKPEPNCIGIYYLSPISLKLINEDFKNEPIYHSINILLNEEVTPEVINSLVSEAKIMERLAFFGELKLGTKYVDNNLGIICE